MPRLFRAVAAAVLCVSASALPVRAQITVHTTLASWLAAVTGAGLDTFDDLDPVAGYYESPLLRTAGSYAYRVSEPNGLYPAGIPGAPGVRDTWLAGFSGLEDLLVDQFTPAAFGVGGEFFLSDDNGALVSSGEFRITVASGATSWTDVIDVGAVTSSFLGFTATAGITSISLRAQDASINNQIFATINNIRIGGAPVSAVPEPASLALLLGGGLGLAGVTRRRSRVR